MLRCIVNSTVLGLMVGLVVAASAPSAGYAAGKPLVVATTTDLADFTRQVGGDKIDVFCTLKAGEDPHFVRPTPSAQRMVSQARLFIQTSLDLETWAPTLLEGARNPNLMVLTATKGVRPLEKPAGGVSPAQGDVHPSGNPHVFHDPTNAKIAVSNILGGLIAILPQDRDYLTQRARRYLETLDAKAREWQRTMAPCANKKLVSYHRSWPYLAAEYRVDFIGEVEPMPGIPPSAQSLARLIKAMKAEGVKVLVTQPFYPRKSADSVARQTGAKVVVLAGYPGASPGTDTYIAMMDYNVKALSETLR